MLYVFSMLGDGYTWSMEAVSSARDVRNNERVSHSVMHYSFVMRFNTISSCLLWILVG